jgi:hypothetical protein
MLTNRDACMGAYIQGAPLTGALAQVLASVGAPRHRIIQPAY